jgi:hypothetical protein
MLPVIRVDKSPLLILVRSPCSLKFLSIGRSLFVGDAEGLAITLTYIRVTVR